MAEVFEFGIDGGHGPDTAGKRTPKIPELKNRVIREFEFNNPTAKYLKAALERCGQKAILLYKENTDTPLKDRTNLANKQNVDAVVSIHFDASDGRFDGKGKDAEGFTIFYQNGSSKGAKLAKIVAEEVNKGTVQKNRGAKSNNLHMTREPKAVSILCECGFMDAKNEALLMIEKDFQKETAEDIARGLSRYFGFKYKAPGAATPAAVKKPATATQLYRVRKTWKDDASQKGAFSSLPSAKDLADKNKGYKVFDEKGNVVYPKPETSTQLYRIRKSWVDVVSQIGAYTDLGSAKDLADKNKGYSVFDEQGNLVHPSNQIYRVRKSWSNVSGQIGAYTEITSAKYLADQNAGYKVFDESGTVVYTPK